jgi:hypothetical protein
MTTNKVLVIVLVIVILLFVVLMVWGVRRNSIQKPPGDPKKDDAKNFSDGRHPILDTFQGVLGPFTPKLKASSLRPALTSFDLQKQPSYSIDVLPDLDHPFRQARVKVQAPGNACAHVVFTPVFAPGSDAPDKLKKPQDSDNPDVNNRNEFSLSIPKGGGRLRIDRESPPSAAPCKVALE